VTTSEAFAAAVAETAHWAIAPRSVSFVARYGILGTTDDGTRFAVIRGPLREGTGHVAALVMRSSTDPADPLITTERFDDGQRGTPRTPDGRALVYQLGDNDGTMPEGTLTTPLDPHSPATFSDGHTTSRIQDAPYPYPRADLRTGQQDVITADVRI